MWLAFLTPHRPSRLTLARGATPGLVAVHSGPGGDWPASSLGMLATAFLIRRFGFSGQEAAVS
jgi:hypothetical protein